MHEYFFVRVFCDRFEFFSEQCPEGEYRSSQMDTCEPCSTEGTEPNYGQDNCGMLTENYQNKSVFLK